MLFFPFKLSLFSFSSFFTKNFLLRTSSLKSEYLLSSLSSYNGSSEVLLVFSPLWVFEKSSYLNWHLISLESRSWHVLILKSFFDLNSKSFYFSLSKMTMKMSCPHILFSSRSFLRSWHLRLHNATFLLVGFSI